MSHKMPIAALLLLVGASGTMAQNLPLFLSAPALPVTDCGSRSASLALSGSVSCVSVGGSI